MEWSGQLLDGTRGCPSFPNLIQYVAPCTIVPVFQYCTVSVWWCGAMDEGRDDVISPPPPHSPPRPSLALPRDMQDST